MMAFPGMLVDAALKAGIKVPLDHKAVDDGEYNKDEFPHWFVFCTLQLGQPMPYPGVHFDNAQVIAKIPDDGIRMVTPEDCQHLGFRVGGFSH